ncbi:hypothetical protein [Parafrankia colletiae]|uniref:hypothetical protein n=1 Tax=Parafrankia colletiae TaxID=573497 RepID=UPI0018E375EB|nr:hypothetical protein [Parafrankia colletiae]
MPRTSRATYNPEPPIGVAPATTSHGEVPGPRCGKPRASGPGGLRNLRRRPAAPSRGAARGRLLGASAALAMLLIAACQNEDSTGAQDASRLAGAAAGLPSTTPARVPATATSPATTTPPATTATTPPASSSPATSPPLAPSTGPAARAATGIAGRPGSGGGTEARAGAQAGAAGPGAPAPAPARGGQPPAAPPPAAQQPAGPTPTAPVTRAAAPPPPPAAPPQQPATSACHPSYSGACLDPNASDYDCEGGSGNGPKYVRGPIEVRGSDPYQLDGDDDGVACE